MQMYGIWIWSAYTEYSLFCADPKKGKVGSGLSNRMEGDGNTVRGSQSKRQVGTKGPP